MIIIIVLVIGISICILVYNFLPEKRKDGTLSNRLDRTKKVDEGKKKEPVKAALMRIIDIVERKLKKINNSFVNDHKERLERKIQKAGQSKILSGERLIAIQIVSSLGVFLFYGVFLCWLLEVVKFNILFVLLSLAVGYMYPNIGWLKSRIEQRTKSILRSLPDMIDLLTICVEAGLDFGAAIRKIVEKGKPGPLRNEFKIMEKEISMGASRIEALRNMANRNDIDGLNSFLIAIIQAVKMGTSLGEILRAQSEQLRIKRSQRAEKLAAQAPIKMLAPLIICIFPLVFIILFVPIIMQLLGLR